MAALNIFHSLVTAAAVLVVSGRAVLRAPLCLAGDFDSQLRHILETQMVSTGDREHIRSHVLDDVQATLNQRWPGHKATLLGSLVTGLATRYSDADIYIQLPKYNTSAALYVLQETEKLFKKQATLYRHVWYLNKAIITSLKFTHIPTQRNVDLLFDYGEMAVAETKLSKYYLNLDKRSLHLWRFLKFWFQNDSGRVRRPHDYVLYLFVIFYLQQKNLAPPVYLLQIDSESYFINDWDVGINELPFSSTNTEDLYQLLGGFFKFYGEFNYEEYIIAPFAGRPISKSAFRDIDNFPIEYSLYSNNLKDKLQHKIKNEFDVSKAVCVQHPFVHSSNEMEELVHRKETETFKLYMKSVATMFEDLPSDRILSAIIVMDQPTRVISHKNATEGGDHEETCIML